MLAETHPVPAVQGLLAQQARAAAREAGSALSLETMALAALRPKLASAVAAGQAPDLALVGGADSAPLAARGLSWDLRDTLDRVVGLNGELFPPLRSVATTGPFVDRPADQPVPVWAVPHASLGGAWLVRQDLLAQKGLALPKTFDDVRSVGAKLANAAGGTFGWGAGLPVSDAVDDLARVVLLGYGGSLFDSLGLQVTLSTDAAAAGLQALARLYHGDDGSPLAPGGAVDWSPREIQAAFAAGVVAQTIDFGGVYAGIVSSQPAVRPDTVALPPPAGPRGWFTSVPTSFLVALRTTKGPARSASLIERLLQPDRYDALVRAGQGSVVPPYAYLTKGPFWDDDPNYPAFAANARGDPARDFQFAPPGYPAPPTLPAAVVHGSGALATALRSVVSGETTPSAAASALKQRCAKLAEAALALQPIPTPTPAPFWLKLLGPTT